MFELNLNNQTNEVISTKDIRQKLVEHAFMQASENILTGAWTRENTVKALQPIVDTLSTGTKVKGHADNIRKIVETNLDSCLEVMQSEDNKGKGK